MITHRIAVVLALVASPALAAAQDTQDTNVALRTSVICAPGVDSSAFDDSPRIVGSQDVRERYLFGTRDVLVIDGGTNRGLQLGQKYVLKRITTNKYETRGGYRAVATRGLMTIIAVNDHTSLGSVDFACDGIEPGDYLQKWNEPVIPGNADRTETAGDLDFSNPARMLFGDLGHSTAAAGEMILINAGQEQGVKPGGRFAIYRDAQVPGVPLTAIGEAVVISVNDETALVRLTRTRDAVQQGDLLIPRK